MKKLFYSLLAVVLAACGSEKQAPIDREALVARNNPQVSSFDSLASLSVGNKVNGAGIVSVIPINTNRKNT